MTFGGHMSTRATFLGIGALLLVIAAGNVGNAEHAGTDAPRNRGPAPVHSPFPPATADAWWVPTERLRGAPELLEIAAGLVRGVATATTPRSRGTIRAAHGGCLDCDIDLEATGARVDAGAQATYCALCTATYGAGACSNMCSASRWEEVEDAAIAAGINPVFMLTLGIEETYMGAANPTYPFGCLLAGSEGFSANLQCALDTIRTRIDEGACTSAGCTPLMSVLLAYASSPSSCTFGGNENFPHNIVSIYSGIHDSSTPGEVTGTCAEQNAPPPSPVPPPGSGSPGGVCGVYNKVSGQECGGGSAPWGGLGICRAENIRVAYDTSCNYGNAPQIHPEHPFPGCTAVQTCPNTLECPCGTSGGVRRCACLPLTCEQACGGSAWIWDSVGRGCACSS